MRLYRNDQARAPFVTWHLPASLLEFRRVKRGSICALSALQLHLYRSDAPQSLRGLEKTGLAGNEVHESDFFARCRTAGLTFTTSSVAVSVRPGYSAFRIRIQSRH